MTKTVQILECARYFEIDQGYFAEKFLCLTFLTRRPRAEYIYSAIKKDLEILNMSAMELCATTGDGVADTESERKGVLSLFNTECDSDISSTMYSTSRGVY